MDDKIKAALSSKKVQHRGVEIDGEKIIVRALVRPSTPELATLINVMKRFKCRKVNGFYGRWVFKKTTAYVEED